MEAPPQSESSRLQPASACPDMWYPTPGRLWCQKGTVSPASILGTRPLCKGVKGPRWGPGPQAQRDEVSPPRSQGISPGEVFPTYRAGG